MMQRRDFIKHTLLATGAVALENCQPKDPYAPRKYEGQIAIIGAGAAGLYAGYLLEQQGANYTIYEAAEQIGGRIRPLKGLADFDVELGAEKIRGSRSTLYDWAKESGASLLPTSGTDYYQIGTLLRTEAQWNTNLDFRLAMLLSQQARAYSGNETTLAQLMESTKLVSRVRHIPDALIANNYGTSANRLGLLGVAEAEATWSAGRDNYLLGNRSLLSVLEEKCKSVIPKVVLNKQIKRIDFTNSPIVLEDAQAQRRFADKVIVTVPLSILQANDIQFTPSLPETKLTAIRNIGMGAGIKVALVFNRRFWEANTGSIYTSGSVPEYWVSSAGRSTSSFVLSGFVTGERAEALSGQTSTVIIQNLLKELDTIYGKGTATASLTNAKVMDWGKEPFIKGAYSFPIPNGGGLLTRQTLSQPIQRKVYFAGEATHYGGHSGTVHGAMESGRRAVEELLRDVV